MYKEFRPFDFFFRCGNSKLVVHEKSYDGPTLGLDLVRRDHTVMMDTDF